jgi:probable HAF family extracellular repeat protein/uncharacterized repeat protein (TIGR03803 family)/YVTN family beta-propeller protein
VSAGGNHACGVRTDGTLACWGANFAGQATPPAGSFMQITAGGSHTCALESNGAVACWGGAAAQAPPPGAFIQISAGDSHTCGVGTDGTIACWGTNLSGQSIAPAGTFTQVSAGDLQSCGVNTDGTATCWGDDTYGQTTPPAGSFTEVSAGTLHSCGLTTDGAIVCWGDNSYGQDQVPPIVHSGDVTPPVLSLPPSITALTSGTAGTAVGYIASASDSVDGAVPVNCAPTSGAVFPIGATTVNCSAVDADGNTATGSFTVTVVDGGFTITDLGTLGGSFSVATAMNASGQVVGYSTIAGEAEAHAFFWTPTAGMIDLGTLGGPYSSAIAVNDAGQVLGSSWLDASGKSHAFLWSATTGMIDVGTLPGASSTAFSEAVALNGSGQVVGFTTAASAQGAHAHAFRWTQAGGMIDLGTFGGFWSYPTAINDAGQVIGYAHYYTGDVSNDNAFLWTETSGLANLGTLGGNSSYAWALNASGQVVGDSAIADDLAIHPFSWTQAGGMTDLGTLNGALHSTARVINAAGQVAGTSNRGLFLWSATTGMVDLGTAGFGLVSPMALNRNDFIVGNGSSRTNELSTALLWTPTAGLVRLPNLGGANSRASAMNDSNQSVGSSSTSAGTTHAVMWQPTVTSPPVAPADGTLTQDGGSVADDVFGPLAQVAAAPGIVDAPTSVAIDVLTSPPSIPLPAGSVAAGTYFVTIQLTPRPSFPLAAPGLTLVLPLINPLAPGTRLNLARVEPATSTLVPSFDAAGAPIAGSVDPSGLSATFAGVVHLSTVVGLIPFQETPPVAQTFAYVANQFSDTLSVIDTASREVIRTIALHQPPDLAGDVALTRDGRFLYITDPGGSVLVLDARTYAAVATIPLGINPDARDIVMSPDGAWAYVVQRNHNTVSVIATGSRLVVATIDVGTLPTRVAFSPDSRFAYVTNGLSSTVSVVETATHSVVDTIPVAAFYPNDIAVVTVGSAVRAYVTAWGAQAVLIIDLSTNAIIESIPLTGAWTIEGSADGSFVAVAQWSLATSGLTIIDTATNAVVSTLAVPVEQANIKLTPDNSHAYLTDFSGNLGAGHSVFVVDIAANAIVTQIPVGEAPFGMAIGSPAALGTPGDSPPAISSAASVTFTAGSAATFTVVTVGAPPASSITVEGALPSGVTFTNHGDGTATLGGTPVVGTSGIYLLTITASNGVFPDATQLFTLTVDEPFIVTSPDTTLTLYPPSLSLSPAATFRFISDASGTFACSLDDSAFVACSSPTSYVGLTNGTHSFQVQATDLADNADPSPATHSWTVDVAADYQVLHYFGQLGQDLTGGALPVSTVVEGRDGLLYGTTARGGASVAFKLDALGNYFVLDTFYDFAEPMGQLTQANDGSFYGTDASGPNGFGAIFKIDPAGRITKIHEMDPTTEGLKPRYGLMQGADGYFYGTTDGPSMFGPATLFRMDSAGQVTVLHAFDPAGGAPSGRLMQAPDGYLYGMTSFPGGGTIYRSTTSGAMSVLHTFGLDQSTVSSGLVLADNGFFYGKTNSGSVFKMDATGAFSVVHDFGLFADAFYQAPLIQATDGNLYGTTVGGGLYGGGTVFRMDLLGNVTTVHSFGSEADGLDVMPGVVQGRDGALYGTTQRGPGAFGAGTVFRLALSAGSAASTLLVQPASGSYGGTTTLSAALTASGVPIAGRIVSFTLNGVPVGSVPTDDAGIASIADVSLADFFAGTYPSAIQASFAGDESFTASTGAADLIVVDPAGEAAQPSIIVTSPNEPIYELGSLVLVQYICVASVTCESTVANGSALDTSTPGPHSFTITATAFGSVTTERVAYAVSSGTAVPPFAALTAWLPGDETATDEVTRAEAMWTGTPAYAAGKVAQAFAVGSGTTIALPLTQTGPFTLQAWVRTPNRLQTEFTGIIASGGFGETATTFQLELDGFGNYRLDAGNGDVSILIGPATDFFQHLAVTFDGVTIAAYLNGQMVESAAWFGPPALGFTTLTIGVDRDATSPFEGFVDEVQVFNRALSDAEVLQTFEAGASGLQKNRAPVAAAVATPNPAEATGPDGATILLDATASTDPDGDALTYLWQEGTTTLGDSATLSVVLSIGTHVVTLVVDDGHRHSASVDVIVVVQDATAPILTNVPGDNVAEATSADGTIVAYESPTATDVVDGAVAVTCAPASGSVFALGATAVTCSAMDAHGNAALAGFIVTVIDTAGPVLTLPPSVVAEATSPAGAAVMFTASAFDSVSGTAMVTCVPASGSTFAIGLTVVTCTATDATGNSTTGGFDVLVLDTTAPLVQIASPSPDALTTASSTAVVVQVTDAVGVASIEVNGVAAILASGTRQAGTWRAIVPAGAGRSLPIDVAATDAAGNAGAALRVVDNDGIPSIAPAALDRRRTDGVDQAGVFSNDFNNGVTSGTLARNGWTARLSNAPTTNGVRVQATSAGVGPARVLACLGAAKEVRFDVVGETADIVCDPSAGTVTVKAVSAVGKIEVWKQTSPTTWTVAQLPTGAIYSTGSPATADPTNASAITVDVVQIDAAGAAFTVGSFELAPGASVDVTTRLPASGGNEQLHFHVLRGAVPFRLGGRTRTLKPGNVTVLPITHGRQPLDE